MRTYEVLFVIAPTTEESEVETLVTQLSDVLTNQGASIIKVDRMGKRRLAYPIQKFTEGHYVVLTIEGTGREIAEVERRMRVIDAIIRYLTIRIDEDLKRAQKFKARREARAAGRKSSRTSGHAHSAAAIPAAEPEEAQ